MDGKLRSDADLSITDFASEKNSLFLPMRKSSFRVSTRSGTHMFKGNRRPIDSFLSVKRFHLPANIAQDILSKVITNSCLRFMYYVLES